MSKLLKRPMFRKGGAVENGIMKLATGGRAMYKNAGPVIDPNDPLLKDAQRREALLTQFGGAPSDTKQDLYDLLISGGLNLVGGVGAGDGTLASVARSFKEPTEKFLAKRPSEEAYKRQLKLAAAQGALSAEDARKLAKEKLKETRTEQVTPAFENVVAAKSKVLSESLPYSLKGRAIDAARKDTYFQRNAPSDLKANFIGVPQYITIQKKGESQTVPVLGSIGVGQSFYDEMTGTYKKRVSKGKGALDFATIDPVTFEIETQPGD